MLFHFTLLSFVSSLCVFPLFQNLLYRTFFTFGIFFIIICVFFSTLLTSFRFLVFSFVYTLSLSLSLPTFPLSFHLFLRLTTFTFSPLFLSSLSLSLIYCSPHANAFLPTHSSPLLFLSYFPHYPGVLFLVLFSLPAFLLFLTPHTHTRLMTRETRVYKCT